MNAVNRAIDLIKNKTLEAPERSIKIKLVWVNGTHIKTDIYTTYILILHVTDTYIYFFPEAHNDNSSRPKQGIQHRTKATHTAKSGPMKSPYVFTSLYKHGLTSRLKCRANADGCIHFTLWDCRGKATGKCTAKRRRILLKALRAAVAQEPLSSLPMEATGKSSQTLPPRIRSRILHWPKNCKIYCYTCFIYIIYINIYV